ncbi:Eco57I restriction-modification methylase domain-containing protein [Microbacterium sp. NPDC077663]|uniref:Eco57I restriction-modification methylase domain-containing protein n=1 Tax=Microbacterium sp. NPDC077663 TaxID=3364189 RepID=UPI0037C5A756
MSTLADVTQILARPLGPRGSRGLVGSADPAAELTPVAVAVLAAIPAWWSARATRAGLAGEWTDVHFAVDVLPPLVLGETPPLEPDWGLLTGEQVGAAYVESLASETRARHGRHYTPHELAAELWSMTKAALGMKQPVMSLPGLIRDPACGAGALLLPALREHLAASAAIDPRLVLNRLPTLIEGIDSDPAAVWVANVVLAAEMLPMLARIPEANRRPLPALAHVGDGLAPDRAPARAVLMNPPYGRVRLSEADRARFAKSLYGHANLYGMFMAVGAESLDASGVLSALVPTSFTAGRYFEALRTHLTSQLRLESVAFVADRSGVFTSVLQETCLATLTRRRVRKVSVRAIGSAVEEVATISSPTGGNPWILPRRSDLAPVAAAAAKLPNTLATAGWKVSTGPLVWNRRKDDLFARPANGRHPIIWAADIDGGAVHRDASRASTRYLALHSERDRQVMVLADPAVLVQRTTAPEQQRRLVVAELTEDDLSRAAGVVVENHVNVIRPVGDTQLLSRHLLTRLLSTRALDKLIRCISGSVALSAYELESITLPDAQTLEAWETLSDEELERAVARTYGLPEQPTK